MPANCGGSYSAPNGYSATGCPTAGYGGGFGTCSSYSCPSGTTGTPTGTVTCYDGSYSGVFSGCHGESPLCMHIWGGWRYEGLGACVGGQEVGGPSSVSDEWGHIFRSGTTPLPPSVHHLLVMSGAKIFHSGTTPLPNSILHAKDSLICHLFSTIPPSGHHLLVMSGPHFSAPEPLRYPPLAIIC